MAAALHYHTAFAGGRKTKATKRCSCASSRKVIRGFPRGGMGCNATKTEAEGCCCEEGGVEKSKKLENVHGRGRNRLRVEWVGGSRGRNRFRVEWVGGGMEGKKQQGALHQGTKHG